MKQRFLRVRKLTDLNECQVMKPVCSQRCTTLTWMTHHADRLSVILSRVISSVTSSVTRECETHSYSTDECNDYYDRPVSH